MTPVAFVTLGYLLGSVPFAWLLARQLRGVDIRLAGSGNVGATNVFRVTGPSAALVVAILDLAKGACAVLLARQAAVSVPVQVSAGVAAVIGHAFPIWLGFRGGKGVATACGVFAVLAPAASALAVFVFFLTVWWTRYVSLGSIGAALVLPPLAYWFAAPLTVVAGAAVCTAIIVERHSANLARLRSGTERRLNEKP